MAVHEVEGHTLRLAGPARGAPRTPRVVRLSLVQRDGIFGPTYNVREFRAESDPAGGLRLLGAGRLLAMRWSEEAPARRELTARRRLLEDLGYAPSPGHARVRGEWDWLSELIARELEEGDDLHAAQTTREAMVGLGLRVDAVLEGVAAVLGLSPAQFECAQPELAQLPPIRPLVLLLTALADHPDPRARAAVRRWLEVDAVVYDVPVARLAAWLSSHEELAPALHGRVEAEGLALLGVPTLRTLAEDSAFRAVRNSANRWLARVQSRVVSGP